LHPAALSVCPGKGDANFSPKHWFFSLLPWHLASLAPGNTSRYESTTRSIKLPKRKYSELNFYFHSTTT
jgi:hypothetical protein